MEGSSEAEKVLELFESRIKRIEERFYSKDKGQEVEDGKIAELIFEAQRQLKDAEGKSQIAGSVFKHLKSLENYLSVEFLERVNATPDTKADIIIAGEKQLKETAKSLEEVNKYKETLDERKLLDVPKWSAKLEPLAQVEIQQKDECDELNDRVNQLLTTYNTVISSISKQFIQWDNVVTQCEIAVETARAASQN